MHRVTGTVFICSGELVQEQACSYESTISENESMILRLWAKRENGFTIWGRSRLWSHQKQLKQGRDMYLISRTSVIIISHSIPTLIQLAKVGFLIYTKYNDSVLTIDEQMLII